MAGVLVISFIFIAYYFIQWLTSYVGLPGAVMVFILFICMALGASIATEKKNE